MSVESGSKLFDNQMATMAVLTSHLIIINHKGEISSNLGNLLGITFYAKLRIAKTEFKPSILFVLRDQSERNANIKTQIAKLKEKLNEETKFIQESLDSIFDIDADNLILLPNAFSEDIGEITKVKYKWRNKIFSSDVLKLRHRLVTGYMVNEMKNADKHRFDNMHDLYTKMSSNWTTIENHGDSILSCKDLEEIRVRNELSKKVKNIINGYEEQFKVKCDEIIKENYSLLEKNYNDHLMTFTKNKLEETFNDTKETGLANYKKQTNLSIYPESLKNEFENRIKNNLEWIKDIYLMKWKDKSETLKHSNNLETEKQKIIKDTENILNNTNDDINYFRKKIQVKFDELEVLFEKKVEETYPNDDKIVEDLVYKFNNSRQIMRDNIFIEKSKDLNMTKVMNFVFNQNFDFKNEEYKNWYSTIIGELKNRFSDKPKLIIESIKRIINDQVLTEIFNNIGVNYCIDDTVIRNIIQILTEHLFNTKSILLEKRKYFKIDVLINDIIFVTLRNVFLMLKGNRENAKTKEKNEYKRLQKETAFVVYKDFLCKNNSKETGSHLGDTIVNNLFSLMQTKLQVEVCDEMQNEILKQIKSPENLIELAYNKSFGCSNYPNVFKYATDINKYCLEVLTDMTSPHIKEMLDYNINEITLGYRKLLNSITQIDANSDQIKKTRDFLQILTKFVSESDNLNYFANLFQKLQNSITNLDIKNFDIFKNSFKVKINEKTGLDEQINVFKEEFYRKAHDKHKIYIDIYLGCNSTCPLCGSKCNLKKGHIGGHCSTKHIFMGFQGWKCIETNVVRTVFCWSEFIFKNSQIWIGEDKVYKNGEIYLTECHKDWLQNVNDNYLKFGHTPDFNDKVIKAWMNTRKPLIFKYRKVSEENGEKKVIDRTDYENSWTNLEDVNSILPENFIPKWNDLNGLE